MCEGQCQLVERMGVKIYSQNCRNYWNFDAGIVQWKIRAWRHCVLAIFRHVDYYASRTINLCSILIMFLANKVRNLATFFEFSDEEL